jgi:glycosyltransferase involved in cell wall biosynthesis
MVKKLRFIDLGPASFIERDIEMLRSLKVKVKRTSYRSVKANVPGMLLVQLFTEPFRQWDCNALFVHFAGWHALVPLLWARLLSKRSVLFLHGTDCVSIKSIDYGNFRKQPLAWVTMTCYKLARVLAPVHETLVHRTDRFNDGVSTEQGVQRYCPSVSAEIHPIHHGFDPDRWPIGTSKDLDVVLTVGYSLHKDRVRLLKGIDLLISVAPYFPKHTFVIVGYVKRPDEQLPSNVEVHPSMDRESLILQYQRAGLYAQLSLSEGFGCALAEAMLCGCVPVVAAAGSLPSIVGNVGFVVNERSVGDLRKALVEAFTVISPSSAASARKRIVDAFPYAVREKGLEELIS